MELSETVKLSLRDAQEDLRNALAYSARTEKPYVSKHIANILADIDNLIDATEIIGKIENRKDGEVQIIDVKLNYLTIPKEIIITTLQSHQRYFPLFNYKNELTNYFFVVSNRPDKNNIIKNAH